MLLFRKKTNKEENKNRPNAVKMIREGEEYAAQCGYDLTQLHCNGCPNSCPVSQVKCTRGRLLQEAMNNLRMASGL